MQADLRKIAAFLREEVKKRDSDKTVKCAQIVQAAIALEQLGRKIGK